nr:coatomer subunit beta'-2 [Ipomoea batatas]
MVGSSDGVFSSRRLSSTACGLCQGVGSGDSVRSPHLRDVVMAVTTAELINGVGDPAAMVAVELAQRVTGDGAQTATSPASMKSGHPSSPACLPPSSVSARQRTASTAHQRLENILDYGLERVWAIGYMKGSRRSVVLSYCTYVTTYMHLF